MTELKANRLKGVEEYYFADKLKSIAQLKANGADIINLGIGSPDLPPPTSVVHTLSNSLSEPLVHQYQSYKGIPTLRTAFSNWYKRYFDTQLNAETEILPLIGSKEGIMHCCMALLNHGDEVFIPNPGYATYKAAVKLAGATPKSYPLLSQNNYLPDFEYLEKNIQPQTKMMWINYPHMPTGTEATQLFFNQLLEFSRKYRLIIVNDNPYAFTLTKKYFSFLKGRKESDLVLELNSLSKSHNMSGWRVGMIGGNNHLISHIHTFKSNMDSGMFKPIMLAATKALAMGEDWYNEINAIYKKRQQIIYQICDALGCEYDTSRVGMFVWAQIPENEKCGASFSDRLLSKHQVFVAPGFIFGDEGDRYVRFSLCTNIHQLKNVLKRINR